MKLPLGFFEVLGIGCVAIVVSNYIGDWLGGASLVALWLGYKLLNMGDRIPILFLAFAFQWTQVTVGVFYAPLFGRTLMTVLESDYRPMVMIGLGCVLALACGIRLGVIAVRRLAPPRDDTDRLVALFSWPLLIALYGGSIFIEGALVQYQGEFSSLRQILVSATVVRYVLLFLTLRRLTYPTFQWHGFGLLLAIEVVLGFTTYFAGFREPLVFGVIALFEVFDRRRLQHWVALGALVGVMAAASVVWMGVRDAYRKDLDSIDTFATSSNARLNRMSELSGGFLKRDTHDMLGTVDQMIDRIWAVYYPALALARVPRLLPHTDGAMLLAAVQHVLAPRVFFPDKPELPSDSEKVRKYSGVWVAGREEGTTIAFGYAAESYVDFGVPMMFAPIFGFGLFMGAMYAWFLKAIRSHEIAIALVTVVFWLSLYLFERSWANNLGYTLGMIVYLGIPVVILDRFFLARLFVRAAPPFGETADSFEPMARSAER